jgi:hypothetical protein
VRLNFVFFTDSVSELYGQRMYNLTEIRAEPHTIRGSFRGGDCGVYSVFCSVGNGVTEAVVPVVKPTWSETQYTDPARG